MVEGKSMGQHYSRNTVSVSKWCNHCRRNTPHRVTDRRVNDCLECIARVEREHEQRAVDDFRKEFDAAKQKELFG